MRLGPYTLTELQKINLYGDDYIWKDEFSKWTRASAIPDLQGIIIPIEHCQFTMNMKDQTMFPSGYQLRKPKQQLGRFVNTAGLLVSVITKGVSWFVSMNKAPMQPALGK